MSERIAYSRTIRLDQTPAQYKSLTSIGQQVAGRQAALPLRIFGSVILHNLWRKSLNDVAMFRRINEPPNFSVEHCCHQNPVCNHNDSRNCHFTFLEGFAL